MADRSVWADFAVERELGRGTWGTVLLARRRQDDQLYALKTVALDRRSLKDQMAAVQECQVLASLDSPYITRYYDSFLHDGKLVIVMEWACGGSLHAAIGRSPRPLPEEMIWRVLLHITLALHHMHSRRMLHRDVKSMNVFLTGPLDARGQYTQIKLGDVGVSKVLEDGKDHASTLIGTPFYLSPEICQEKPYDAKSDIWALGVVLYECATRRHPFDAQSQPSLILKILRGKYDPVVGLSPDLTALIHRCLSQNPARRPTAERLLCLPSVRAKAAELGVELPATVLAEKFGSFAAIPGGDSSSGGGGGGGAATGSNRKSQGHSVARVAAEGRAEWRAPQVPPRRATCPHPPSTQVAGVPQGRRGRLSIAAAGQRTSQEGGVRPLLSVVSSSERRKAPLPAAAVPQRRKTDQPGRLAAESSLNAMHSPLAAEGSLGAMALRLAAESSLGGMPPRLGAEGSLSAMPPRPTAEGSLNATPPRLVGQGSLSSAPYLHEVAPLSAVDRSSFCMPSTSPGVQPEPSLTRRETHFSVQQHLRSLSGAAQQWLAQRSSRDSQGPHGLVAHAAAAAAAAAAATSAGLEVERSYKSDSSVLQLQRQHLSGEHSDLHASPLGAAAAEADGDRQHQAMLASLKRRCVELLGSETALEELYSLAQEGGSSPAAEGAAAAAASAAKPRPPTLAALSDALFARVGYNAQAAEALHLLMRMLALSGSGSMSGGASSHSVPHD